MKTKKQLRVAAKVNMVSDCVLRAARALSFFECMAVHTTAMAISSTPAKVFRVDGKVDKRRYRRYVSRHRRVALLRINRA